MKTRFFLPLLLALSLHVRAESAKSYQVTGPIVALTEHVITVQKGDDRWEIARSANTKVEGKLAVGSRVTVYYTMSAESVDVKEPATKTSPTQKADAAAEKAAQRSRK